MDVNLPLIIGSGLLFLLLLYAFTIYNGLVRLRNNIERNLANIDVLLKQRHTELPQLVAVCKGYMKHERETLEQIVRARTAVNQAREDRDIGAMGKAETTLRNGLGRLFMVVEQYPAIKADQQFLKLQQRIGELENSIADRREFFNESVRLNNTRIQQVPDVLFARMFGFGPAEYLEFPDVSDAPVSVAGLWVKD